MQTSPFTTSRSSLSAKSNVAQRLAAPLRPAVVPHRMRLAPTAALKSKVKYDPSAKTVDSPVSAFTRRREVFVGRTAMGGFLAAVIGELLTGKGPIGQLSLELGVDPGLINIFFLGLVAVNFVTALFPGSPTFSESNQQDVRKRPSGPIQKPQKTSAADRPDRFFGTSSQFGFTKKNELFVGRTAMIGFASALIGEKLTGGKGPLGQLGVPLGLELNPTYGWVGLAVWVGFFLVAAIGYGNFGQQEGDEEIY
nr:chloroplast photosystem II subunit S [Lobosphaera incisa]